MDTYMENKEIGDVEILQGKLKEEKLLVNERSRFCNEADFHLW